MYSILLTVHVLVTISLITVILMQNSASDSTGLSGSSSTSFLSGRAAAGAITKLTAFLATAFILTSLGLGIITTRSHADQLSIIDRLGSSKPAATAPATPGAPAAPVPATPAKPSVPRPE